LLVLLLGIDGGGTSTAIVLASPNGTVAVEVSAPGSNVVTTGVAGSIRILEDAVDAVLEKAGSRPAEVVAAVAGLAGVGAEPERSAIAAWLTTRFPGRPTSVVTDVELLLAAGTTDGVGLAVVSGTGSVAFARNEHGMISKAGGWGVAIGDNGSGHAIGAAALRAVAESADGLGPTTDLSRAIKHAWQLPSTAELASPPRTPVEVAALATLVAQVANGGDPVAIAILDRAGTDLAALGAAAASRLDWSRGIVSCALGGGVLVHVPSVRASFVAGARRHGITLGPVVVVDRPVTGALRLAQRLVEAASAP
jgi:N-acetylglucosamine kinase-like BadF-type ATPase